jgi:acyl carrier protein
MDIESINNRIVEIVNLYRSKDKTPVCVDDLDKKIFGDDLQGDAYELLGVFIHIENEFSISITEDRFEKYSFRNMRTIGELVFDTINEKSCNH